LGLVGAGIASSSIADVDVRDQGAKGDGLTDDTAAFVSAFAGGNKRIYVPAGDYLIHSYVRVFANTDVILHPDAVILNGNDTQEFVFLNGELGNTTYATGYAGDGNIHISGVTIDNLPRAGQKKYSEAMAFGHAENILIENMHFRNNYMSHFLELNAVKNGTVRNCTFTNLNPGGALSREAINIDYSGAGGFPQFGGYDGTMCTDILIESCTFTSVQDGVGTHSDASHRNIRVSNSRFYSLYGPAVHARGWVNGSITDNMVSGCGTRAVHLDSATGMFVHANTFIDCGNAANATHPVVAITAGSGNIVGPNRITSTHPNMYRIPYSIASGSGHSVQTLGATIGTQGELAENRGVLCSINDVLVAIIQNNGVAVINPPGDDKQGLVQISMRSALPYSPRGLFWFRTGAGPVMASVASLAAPKLTLTTATALTGTTGAVGNVTISAHTDGSLYIENRSGAVRSVDLRFCAG
jgi:hypothetical protein